MNKAIDHIYKYHLDTYQGSGAIKVLHTNQWYGTIGFKPSL